MTEISEAISVTMQLKLGIHDSVPPYKNLPLQYSLLALCNKCGAMHDMAVSVMLNDGPIEKQSIGHVYNGKTLPKSLADLTSRSVSCPRQEGNPSRKISTKYFTSNKKLITL